MKKSVETSGCNPDKKSKQKNKRRKCRVCPKTIFKNEEEYLLHIRDQHDGKEMVFHMCSDCGKQFKTKSELTHHINSKCGTIKQYKCKECGQELMTAGSLHNHMLRHVGVCKYMCRFCAKMFLTAGQLKVHERIHTYEKAFVCEVCGKGFCHRQSLITHSTLHTGIKPFQCESCGSSFSCIGNLLKHRKTRADTCGLLALTTHRVKHPSTKLKVRINTPANSRLKTIQKQKLLKQKLEALDKQQEQCGKSEEMMLHQITLWPLGKIPDCNSSIFKKHGSDLNVIQNAGMDDSSSGCLDTMTEILSNSFECEIIEEVNDKGSSTHLAAGEGRKRYGIKRKLSCRLCQKTYTNFKSLSKHEKEHEVSKVGEPVCKEQRTGKSKFKCSCCKITFHAKEECIVHQHNEHADLLTCFECDKIFANPDSLRSHQNTLHRGQRRKVYSYVCDKCGRQFRQRALLTQHVNNRCADEPQFPCPVCKKDLSSEHARQAHMRIHDPDKKLLCRFCGKGFRWKGQLKIHERSHTGEKPFNCLYCPKAFAYRESLITHSSLHTGIKPHLCEACGSRFSCIGNLLKHRVTHAATCGVWYEKNSTKFCK